MCIRASSTKRAARTFSPPATASRLNYLDLDPTYKDAWGLPLLRMTFDFPDNDIRMSQYIADKVVEIGRAMGGKQIIRNAEAELVI